MLATDLRHAPACATTLIVSLGLLSTAPEGLLVIAAVTALVAVHGLDPALRLRAGGWWLPQDPHD